MRILLSNDDSIWCPNLHKLHAALKKAGHDVRVVAPDSQKSGASSSLAVHSPLLVQKVSLTDEEGNLLEGHAVSGTPADSVILALNGLLPDFSPELVITGINVGANAGMDIFFSGTVGAAMQAAMYGIPALATSFVGRSGLTAEHADLVAEFAGRVEWKALPERCVYNLNLPDCPVSDVKGLKVCPHSTHWPRLDSYEQRVAPDGREYFWMIYPLQHFELDDEGFDKGWLHRGWATLTPLRGHFNDESLLESVKDLEGRF